MNGEFNGERRAKDISMNSIKLGVLLGTVFCFSSISPAFVLNDYSPLAVGNWWQYASNTGTLKYTVVSSHLDTFIVSVESGVQQFEYRVYSDDAAGLFYEYKTAFGDDWIMYSGYCGPHAGLPSATPVITPLSTYTRTSTFVTFRHGAGYSANINAPGVGIVAFFDSYWSALDTSARLSSYQLEPGPTGRAHSRRVVNPAADDTAAAVSWSGSDSVTLRFCTLSSPCGDSIVSVSYNPLTKNLRLYLADTSGICGLDQLYEHTVIVGGLNRQQAHHLMAYKVKFPGDYPATQFLFSKNIAPSHVAYQLPINTRSRGRPMYTDVFDITGRKIVSSSGNAGIRIIRNQHGGTRLFLDCLRNKNRQ